MALLLASILAGCTEGLLDPMRNGPPSLDGPYDGTGCPAAGQVAVGDTLLGRLGGDGCRLADGTYADRWELMVGGQMSLRMDLTSSDFDAFLEIYDDRGHWVHGDDDSGGGLNARLLTALSPGSYSVVARSYAPHSVGAYRLVVAEVAACPEHSPLVLGETVARRLGEPGPGGVGEPVPGHPREASCYYDLWAPADSFALSIDEETILTFQVKSSEGMPRLAVRDAQGGHVVEGWAGDDGWIVERATLEAGDYAVYVFRDPYQPPYDYTLMIDAVDCAPRGGLAPGEAVKATLELSDCARSNGAVWHAWTFELGEASEVRIDLESDDFDAFLTLRDTEGQIVAEDDDGGSGLNARIQHTLSAGVYEVVVTSFRSGQSGAYTLSMDVAAMAGGGG